RTHDASRFPYPTLFRSDAGVSRLHARIVRLGHGSYILEDLTSTQGTFIGGTLVRGSVKLQSHDVITLGQSGPRLSVIWEARPGRSEEHTSELQSRENLV